MNVILWKALIINFVFNTEVNAEWPWETLKKIDFNPFDE